MEKRKIETNGAPQAIGPYSQAIVAGDLLFCSGQIPADPSTGELVAGGIAEQTTQVFNNLQAVLFAAGLRFKDVVKVTVYLKNMDDFAQMNEIYAKYCKEPYPARATVEVARLPKDVLVEIDLVAYLER